MIKKIATLFIAFFTNKFLSIFSIISLYFLEKIKVGPFFSELFWLTIFFYLFIYFFISLFNFFKKGPFLLNGLIFVVGFLFLREIFQILPDDKDFADFTTTFFAIFFLSFAASFFANVTLNIFLFFSKRTTLLKLLSSFIFLITALFLFYPPKLIWEKAVELYYQKINKKAGIIFYEKKYQKLVKEDFDLRKKIEDILNYFEKETNFNFDYLKDNKKLIEDYFKQKDFLKKQILEVNKKQSAIKLSKQYEEFFSLRKKALEEKKESDEIFEGTVKMYIDAFEIYDNFWDFVTGKRILINTVLAKENKNKEEFLKLIDAYQKDLDKFYENNVKNVAIPFFDEVRKYMSAYYFSMTEFLTAMKNETLNIEDPQVIERYNLFGTEFVSGVENDEFEKWRVDVVKDHVDLYSEKTITAYHLYKKTYSFAKKNKLEEIIKVWGNDYPMKELKIE